MVLSRELSVKDIVRRYCTKDDVKTWLDEVRRKKAEMVLQTISVESEILQAHIKCMLYKQLTPLCTFSVLITLAIKRLELILAGSGKCFYL